MIFSFSLFRTVIKTLEELATVEEKGSGEIQVEVPSPDARRTTPAGRKTVYDYESIPSKPIDRDVLIDGNLGPDPDYPISPEDPYSNYDRFESETETEHPDNDKATKATPKPNLHVIKLYPEKPLDVLTRNNYNNPDKSPTSKPRTPSPDSLTTDLIPEFLNRHNAIPAKSETLDTLVDLDDLEPIKVDPGPDVSEPDDESGSGSGFSSGEVVDEEIELGLFTTTSPLSPGGKK